MMFHVFLVQDKFQRDVLYSNSTQAVITCVNVALRYVKHYGEALPLVQGQGAVSIRKTVLPGMAIPMLKIRRPNGRLIFNMEIAIRR